MSSCIFSHGDRTRFVLQRADMYGLLCSAHLGGLRAHARLPAGSRRRAFGQHAPHIRATRQQSHVGPPALVQACRPARIIPYAVQPMVL